jgi:hypothetical protein
MPLLTSSKYLVILIATTSFLLLLLSMSRELNIYDESVVSLDGILVLKGDILHRDFYANYGPGQYYALAFLYYLFGKGFFVERIYALVIRAGLIGVLFYIVRAQCSILVALIFTTMGGLWLLGIGYYLYPIFPCMLISLIGSYLVTRVSETKLFISWQTAGAGVCTGLTALFRYDVGFFVLIIHFLSIAVLISITYPGSTRICQTIRVYAAYGLGTAVVFLPVAIAFLIVSSIKPFIADIVDFSTKYYPAMRGLPFPGMTDIRTHPMQASVYLPLLAGALAMAQFILLVRRGDTTAAPHSTRHYSLEYLTVFGLSACILFLKGIVRVSPLHMMMGIFPGLIVFAVLVDLWWRRGLLMRSAAVLLTVFAGRFPIAISKGEIMESARVKDRSIAGWLAIKAGLFSARDGNGETCDSGPASDIAKIPYDYARVANYIAAQTQPNERILVALNRHDKIFINPIVLYIAAGRLPGTHWHQFDPGLQTRADIQSAIIDEINKNKVRWVVRDASFDDVEEPNESARSSGVFLLDHYLDENFRPVASSGKVVVWLANREAPIVSENIGKCEATPLRTKSE